jgi:hypothetical protein
MCIFGYGKAQFESTSEEKNHLFPDLVRNLAIVPLYPTDLSFELFAHCRTLVRRVHHDDDAVRAVIVFDFLDLLDFSASEASAFALDRASAGIWIYWEND